MPTHVGGCQNYIGVILGLYWGYIRVVLGLYWGYIGVIWGIMEKKMETTILGLYYIYPSSPYLGMLGAVL